VKEYNCVTGKIGLDGGERLPERTGNDPAREAAEGLRK
jgi:hypothetical protein